EAPEIAKVVAERLGYDRVEGVVVDWGALIPGLQSGRFDVIAAGMYITPERAENVDFSNPTYAVGEAFLVQKGNPKGLHSYQDVLEDPEARLGVVQGTVEVGYAEDLGIPKEQVVIYGKNLEAVAGVQSGRIDAFAGTALTVREIINKLGADADVEQADPFENPVIDGEEQLGYGAFAFRPEDDELRDSFNRVLAGFIGSEEHRALVEPFGFTEKELPGAVIAEELSQPKDGDD
ncbi:MAG: ectoine/hydroxyectoine ABC transporter substrate-binding protein EhuB, partial [Planctomycetota bacterium]